MNATTSIRIDHLTRVEGHGSVDIRIRDGRVERCQWQVVEAPRFFEAMLRGRKWYEVAHVASRICGICSIGHTLASLKATEAAMGIKVSEPVVNLRKLLLHAENIQSHVLHLGYLVLPDLFQAPSVIPLASTHTAAGAARYSPPPLGQRDVGTAGRPDDASAECGGGRLRPMADPQRPIEPPFAAGSRPAGGDRLGAVHRGARGELAGVSARDGIHCFGRPARVCFL